MQEQVIKIHIKDLESLGKTRCFPNLKIAKEKNWIWLKGMTIGEKLAIEIQALPAQQTFVMDRSSRLFPIGKVTPIGQLPTLEWLPLHHFLKVEIPIAALPAQVVKKHFVKLKKAKIEQKNTALLTDVSTWKKYANSASKIRLQALKFAASNQERVLIWGQPLPAIPGQTFWWIQHCFLPSGYDFDPPILANLLASKMDLKEKSVLLFDKNGDWQKIDLENFVKANRSAIRDLK